MDEVLARLPKKTPPSLDDITPVKPRRLKLQRYSGTTGNVLRESEHNSWILQWVDKKQLIPKVVDAVTWRYAFMILAPGPILGVFAHAAPARAT